MDIQKEREIKFTRFGICEDKKCDGYTHIVEECVKCLRLFCPSHSWLTPRGNACIDCYPALHPEVFLAATLNYLEILQ